MLGRTLELNVAAKLCERWREALIYKQCLIIFETLLTNDHATNHVTTFPDQMMRS